MSEFGRALGKRYFQRLQEDHCQDFKRQRFKTGKAFSLGILAFELFGTGDY
jgi:hypothetical protein